MTADLQFLLDTNVISELSKLKGEPMVLDFLQRHAQKSALSLVTIAELRRGAAMKSRRQAERGRALSLWIDALEIDFGSRVLGLDSETARIWGDMNSGRTLPILDAFLAATAIQRRLTLVTRNRRHFIDLPVKLLNPWEA